MGRGIYLCLDPISAAVAHLAGEVAGGELRGGQMWRPAAWSEDVEDVEDGGVAERAAAAAGEELAGAGAAEGMAARDEGGALGPRHAHAAAAGASARLRQLRVVLRHQRVLR